MRNYSKLILWVCPKQVRSKNGQNQKRKMDLEFQSWNHGRLGSMFYLTPGPAVLRGEWSWVLLLFNSKSILSVRLQILVASEAVYSWPSVFYNTCFFSNLKLEKIILPKSKTWIHLSPNPVCHFWKYLPWNSLYCAAIFCTVTEIRLPVHSEEKNKVLHCTLSRGTGIE